MRFDEQKDFHGYTVDRMVAWLEAVWASRRWEGLRRVQIIHGRGEALPPALRQWCDHRGIPWSAHASNPGITILYPGQRRLKTHGPGHKPLARPLRAYPREPRRPRAQPATDPGESDLFAAEMERLEQQGRRSLLRSKHSELE